MHLEMSTEFVQPSRDWITHKKVISFILHGDPIKRRQTDSMNSAICSRPVIKIQLNRLPDTSMSTAQPSCFLQFYHGTALRDLDKAALGLKVLCAGGLCLHSNCLTCPQRSFRVKTLVINQRETEGNSDLLSPSLLAFTSFHNRF